MAEFLYKEAVPAPPKLKDGLEFIYEFPPAGKTEYLNLNGRLHIGLKKDGKTIPNARLTIGEMNGQCGAIVLSYTDYFPHTSPHWELIYNQAIEVAKGLGFKIMLATGNGSRKQIQFLCENKGFKELYKFNGRCSGGLHLAVLDPIKNVK